MSLDNSGIGSPCRSFIKKVYNRFRIKRAVIFIVIGVLFFSCKSKKSVDAIYSNARIYTVDENDSIADAMVVDSGKIVKTGKREDLLSEYQPRHQVDLGGKTVFPGFIDAHCHFYGYGLNFTHADLRGTNSWNDVIDSVKKFAAAHHDGWVIGRGWDQNDWDQKIFPSREKLDELFPDRPVFLQRIDGHACIVNKKALEIAHINGQTRINGGEVILKDGGPTGILLDNAMDAVEQVIPKPTPSQISEALLIAQKNCFAVGLTTIDDAGLEKKIIDIIDSLQKKGMLKMRIYAMLTDNDENKNYYFEKGPYKTDRLDVRAFKFYADGALGSRGALLLKPYSDAPHTLGLQLKSTAYFQEQAKLCYNHGFQMCTHAIGDSANRMMLHVYGEVLKGPNDRRWRIEHCQVIGPDDFELFNKYTIVPSVQPTHATSDMYWATDRLGIYRIRGAYAYKDLLNENGWIANGSDFPVEDINPLYGFYAAVSRQDQKGFPAEGFEVKNALSRTEALKGMTLWAAYANFEEAEKGSLEPGKFADFVVLDKDIMKIPIHETFSVKVLATYISGEKVY